MNGTALTAEIVSIGDEMTSGARLDTNTQWISRRLQDLGVEVAFHSTVGDTLQHNINVFQIAAARADVVVATGGLGPTRDDLTREALAGVVDRPLELNEFAMEHIESLFKKRNREMPPRNHVQAMFPQGSQQIFNPQGTAPGIELSIPRTLNKRSTIFALPGVPAEMKRMFDDSVAPRIAVLSGSANCIVHHVMKFFGTGESDMERRLGDMIARDRQPRVGITVSSATISLRISAMANETADCEDLIAQTRREILDRVGDLHYGDGEHFEQQHAINELLLQKEQSVGVVEIGRAALLGNAFNDLDAPSCYRGGVSFATEADLLQFTKCETLETSAKAMRDQFQSDWLLMVSGYPKLQHGSDRPTEATPFHCFIAGPSGFHRSFQESLGGHPSILHARIAKTAMMWFRQSLS